MLSKCVFITAATLIAFLTPGVARAQAIEADNQSAVIFVYHRIGEDNDPSANVRSDQFDMQIDELKDKDYTVRPLTAIAKAFNNHDTLAPRTVGISFDGGHRSIMKTAVPLLLKNGLPFTIFIAPAQLDQSLPDYIGWDDVKKLSRNPLVTFGLHPLNYTHLSDQPDNEIMRQINAAKVRFREQLGMEPRLFAYPFGEFSKKYRALVEKSGFSAAFGQQSAVAYADMDLMSLPRFSMTESYGDIDRFRMIANALPLPAKDLEPDDPYLTSGTPSIGFTIDPALKGQLSSLSCFVSEQPAPSIHIVGDARVELRLSQPLTLDKARINCTLPARQENPDDPQRWRWWGMLVTGP